MGRQDGWDLMPGQRGLIDLQSTYKICLRRDVTTSIWNGIEGTTAGRIPFRERLIVVLGEAGTGGSVSLFVALSGRHRGEKVDTKK